VASKTKLDGQVDPLEEQVLYSWSGPSRLYKERGKEFYSTVFVLGLLISVIMFLIEGLMPVFLIWSVIFVVWVISKNKPEKIENKITSLGIRTIGELYSWEEMLFFWLEEKHKEKVLLRVVMQRKFPSQLGLVLDSKDKDKVKKMVNQFVQYKEPKEGMADKFIGWVGKKIPLDESGR